MIRHRIPFVLTVTCILVLLSCSSAIAYDLTTDNAGAILLRSAEIRYESLAEGRQFAQDIADEVNNNHGKFARVIVFEEHFGTQNRVHWIILFKSLDDYNNLRKGLHGSRGFKALVSPSSWPNFYVQSSIKDRLIQPLM